MANPPISKAYKPRAARYGYTVPVDQSWIHAQKAKWLGVDVDARTHHIYWPGSGKVSVECNVYFGLSVQLEEEESSLDVPSEDIVLPDIPPTPPPTKPPLKEQAVKPTPASDSMKTSQLVPVC